MSLVEHSTYSDFDFLIKNPNALVEDAEREAELGSEVETSMSEEAKEVQRRNLRRWLTK